MELKLSQKIRRISVIFITICLINIVIIFEYATDSTWNLMLGISEIFNIVFFAILFYIFFVKTKIWKFAHTPLTDLDEREVLLSGSILRKAYAIFSVVVLIILLTFSVMERPISIVLAVTLIILAHLMPVLIIAWTEKQINTNE